MIYYAWALAQAGRAMALSFHPHSPQKTKGGIRMTDFELIQTILSVLLLMVTTIAAFAAVLGLFMKK